MDNIEDDYRGYIQKIMILQVIQHIFCEMLIGGRKIVNGDIIFGVTNIRTNVQNDSDLMSCDIQTIGGAAYVP